MARTKQTARTYHSSRKSPRPRFRGIPSLTTYEAPVVIETLSKALRSGNVSFNKKKHEEKRPFRFLSLPAELRNKIYELCVSTSEYITYNERDYCICGGDDHFDQEDSEAEEICPFHQPFPHEAFTRRQSGCFYLISPYYRLPEGPFVGLDRRARKVHANARMTPMPRILEANNQIRSEALPIFYAMNDFVFEDCGCSWVSRWLYKLQPQHLKHIKSISWDGPLDSDNISSLTDTSFVQMSSIIMLMELGILGQCKLRLLPEEYLFEDIHFACILHDKISNLVRRKALTSADAENEKSKLDEIEVDGLVYCVSKKLSDLCKQLDKVYNLVYHASGLGGNSDWKANCGCPDLERKMSWIEKKSLSVADEATSLPHVSDMQSLPAATGSVQDPFIVDDY